MKRLLLVLLIVAACSDTVTTTTPNIAELDLGCKAGTRPVVGGTCAPVGTAEPPAGFEASATWGFHAVLPSPCSGATIAVLGASQCEPIDDCSVAFPPSEATIAVRKNAEPYSDRPDLKVVGTIAEAVDASSADAVIAVDEGEFASTGSLTRNVRFIGRCAGKTALVGSDFTVRVESPIQVGLQSIGVKGASKAAVLINKKAHVTLDRVYVHGDFSGISAGNGSVVEARRSVLEGPVNSPRPNSPTTGVQAMYGGRFALEEIEIRGFQLAIFAQSMTSEVSVARSVVHEQRKLGGEQEALSLMGAFAGSKLRIQESHIESVPGRIALVGADPLDGLVDPTSPGNPPASLLVSSSTLIHTIQPRETSSAIDVVDGASLELDNVSLSHESYAAVGASENASVLLRNSVVQCSPTRNKAQVAFSGSSGSTLTLESSAVVNASQFAIILREASAAVSRSLITGTHEYGGEDFTAFLGLGQAIAVADGSATLTDSALINNEGSAMFGIRSNFRLDRTVVATTHRSAGGWPSSGITGVDARIAIASSDITGNVRGVSLRRSAALLRDSQVTDNEEALRLEGVTLIQTNEDASDLKDGEAIASRTTFARNAVLASSKLLTDE